MIPTQYKISKVFRTDGKVTAIHCGEYPAITVFNRIDIDGERYFMPPFGKVRLYRPNKKTRMMEYVKDM